MKPTRILIVGGSIGGLFAANLLHRAGFDVTVFERSVHGLEGRGAGLVAQREVFDILREVGVERLAHFGVVAQERIHLDRSGAVLQRQHAPQTQLSWDVLFRTFRDLLPAERYVGGRQAVELGEDAHGAWIRFADGGIERGDLLIGADGIGSRVRGTVAGPGSQPAYVGYVTWRGLVPERDMPEDAARQLFGRFAFFDAPGAHMLGYLVPGADGSTTPGERRYNWVWYRGVAAEALDAALTDIDGVRRPYSLAPGRVRPEAVETLRADAGRALPPAFHAAVLAERAPFLHAIFDYAAPHLTSPHIALMGDAAFVARPHTAMGVAKAAGDAFALRDALSGHDDLAAALAAYEAARAPAGRAIVAYGQRLGRSLEIG
ncbi:2-polyprenyl-6-methoxyphenol hydroxylase-like FAD-dependent oxidoreductase [Angulomicrobium tetraedrale]|uniref:2-polyprenyl-6-methoxyphenol hydroxylase-like FAD-dependent oxidoreductase n=1 Tax=Ancylobacter tetraedralis TaxID=217068 RepID=A0A839ZD96_9HYPH|nr:FAD binding domain-containing protein [Ancylobacter tetraedralis]MBB3772612.1 2-polyprenyl-6-methoxyphenol hydroxylase-like FAD-dependent oxidoreductase [Ancylobacter tetraedralis]